MEEWNVAIGLRADGSGEGASKADGSSSRNQDLRRGWIGEGSGRGLRDEGRDE